MPPFLHNRSSRGSVEGSLEANSEEESREERFRSIEEPVLLRTLPSPPAPPVRTEAKTRAFRRGLRKSLDGAWTELLSASRVGEGTEWIHEARVAAIAVVWTTFAFSFELSFSVQVLTLDPNVTWKTHPNITLSYVAIVYWMILLLIINKGIS